MGTHHCNHCFKDSISFMRIISLSPSESLILLKQSNCLVGNVKYALISPVTMEVVCFGWGKIHIMHKIHIIAHLVVSLSVPLSHLVHTGVWDVVYPGGREELGSGRCHMRQLWEIPLVWAVAPKRQIMVCLSLCNRQGMIFTPWNAHVENLWHMSLFPTGG